MRKQTYKTQMSLILTLMLTGLLLLLVAEAGPGGATAKVRTANRRRAAITGALKGKGVASEDPLALSLDQKTQTVSAAGGVCYTVEISNNGLDDDCDGDTDEADSIDVNSRITNGATHAEKTTEFWAAGELVDRVDMGYTHWSAASGDTADPDGDANDMDNSFGEHNGQPWGSVKEYCFFYSGGAVEWDFDVPEPGYYILSFFSHSSNERQITPSYDNGQELITLPNSTQWIDMYLIYFYSPGLKRISAYGNNRNYLHHSRLFKLREHPLLSFGLHPRLGTTTDTLADFRQRVNRGWITLFTNDVIADAERLITQDLSRYDTGNPRGHEGDLADLAVAYLATGDTRYADYGIEALRRVVAQETWMWGPVWSYLEMGEYGLATALAYDSFFERMTQGQKEEILRAADRHFNYLFVNSLHAEHFGDNSHWWSMPIGNNWNPVINAGGLGNAAIAFKGDNKYAAQWLEQAVKTQYWFLDSSFDQDGAYSESLMYNGYALGAASLFYEALLREEGIDFVHYNDDIILKNAYYSMYFFEPSRWNDSPFDQMGRWGIPTTYKYVGPPDPFWFFAAKVNNDGIIQRFCRAVYGDLRPTDRYHDYAGYLPRSVLAYGEVEDIPPEQWDIPLGKVWPGYGRVVMRSGFEDTNDYYFAMHSGLYGSHGHADQSSFIIYALGQVLVDDTYYSNIASTYQNVILVDGQGQKEAGWETYSGSIDSFLHTAVVDYALADSTLGYLQNDVNIQYNKRNALFIRPSEDNDGYFVLADNIKANQPHEYQWGLHHQTNGHTIQSLGDNNYKFESTGAGGDTDLEIQFASPDSTNFAVSGDKLTVIPALPQEEEHFTVLLYPTDSAHLLPSITKINNSEFSGFVVGEDRILYNKNNQLNTYDNITTNAELTFIRDTAAKEIISVFEGTEVNYGGLGMTLSVATNILLEKEANDYTITIGNEAQDKGATTLTLQGIQQGTYRYYLDGVYQGEIVTTTGTLEISLTLENKRNIVLEYSPGGLLPGDFDEDGDVDMDDYAVFEEAYTGAGRPVAPGYEYADLDGDGDVDLDDFAIFAANYTG